GGHLRGITLGTPVAEVTAREGAPRLVDGTAELDFPLDDPFENGRRVLVRIHQQIARTHQVAAFFSSRDRLDVDSAYRLVRKHLQGVHGRPDQEKTGVLKFVYTLKDSPHPAKTSVCRYKNDAGDNVLEVATRPDGELRFQGGLR
ncbi:MAG: hypothetical protein KC656_22535, partial [Myxococcales bacterium]|nr:hypothetical protein [Myxococcales bacterium]